MPPQPGRCGSVLLAAVDIGQSRFHELCKRAKRWTSCRDLRQSLLERCNQFRVRCCNILAFGRVLLQIVEGRANKFVLAMANGRWPHTSGDFNDYFRTAAGLGIKQGLALIDPVYRQGLFQRPTSETNKSRVEISDVKEFSVLTASSNPARPPRHERHPNPPFVGRVLRPSPWPIHRFCQPSIIVCEEHQGFLSETSLIDRSDNPSNSLVKATNCR
jgi:hypothetical protein